MIRINKRHFVHIVNWLVCTIARECNEHTCSGLEWHTHTDTFTRDIDSLESVQRESPLFISVPHPPLSFCLSFSFLFSFCDSADSSCLDHNERLWGIDCTVCVCVCVCLDGLSMTYWEVCSNCAGRGLGAENMTVQICSVSFFTLFFFSLSMASCVESHFPFIKSWERERERERKMREKERARETDSERGNGRVGEQRRRFVWQ